MEPLPARAENPLHCECEEEVSQWEEGEGGWEDKGGPRERVGKREELKGKEVLAGVSRDSG